jgi:hypothetical protein
MLKQHTPSQVVQAIGFKCSPLTSVFGSSYIFNTKLNLQNNKNLYMVLNFCVAFVKIY